jgi:hypothetical protein
LLDGEVLTQEEFDRKKEMLHDMHKLLH